MNMAISNGDYKDAKSLIADYNVNIKKNELAADYNEAIKFEENGRLDLAYNIYKKLPDDYEDCSVRINKIKKYINFCGEYQGESMYYADTMKKSASAYNPKNTKAIVTITFERDEPILNLAMEHSMKLENYKIGFNDMPIFDKKDDSFRSEIIIRFSDGILYRDDTIIFSTSNTRRTEVIKFKKL